MRRHFACITMLALFASIQATAGSPAAESTTDRSHPFVRHAEEIYRQYLDAQRRGDLELYKRTRAKENYEGMLRNLAGTGKTVADMGTMLKEAAAGGIDIARFQFLRCDGRTDGARLLYRRDGRDDKGPTVEFAAFMIHHEGGAWRIGWVDNSSGPKTFMGKERGPDELLDNPRFALE